MAFDGRVAVVTGGAQGLGKEICEVFLTNKCKVCLADIIETNVERTAKEFEDKFGKSNVTYVQCDISQWSSFENAFLKTKEAFGKVDILICNAGVANEENWENMIDVNLKGNIIGYKLAEKHMSSKDDTSHRASVIFVSSIAADGKADVENRYNLSHLILCSKNTAVTECSGIAVNAVCPSGMKTELSETLGNKMKAMKTFRINAKNYFGFIEFNEVTDAIRKLIEDNVTGSVITITDKFGEKPLDPVQLG